MPELTFLTADSITQGFQSTKGNGYRQNLIDLLNGNLINMVGHYTSGNMADPEEQGIDGATIQKVIDNVRSALQLRPNVVLLHAGTNDMYVKYDQNTRCPPLTV
jgi:lysophospholipase L1-like esterase